MKEPSPFDGKWCHENYSEAASLINRLHRDLEDRSLVLSVHLAAGNKLRSQVTILEAALEFLAPSSKVARDALAALASSRGSAPSGGDGK